MRSSQPDQEFLQQTNYYKDAKDEIDSFGPNQQLIQQFGQNVSGRAANMLQQAGLAELGPFLKNFRMWKLQRYEAAWCAAQHYWTADRMLRVTGDQQVAQFMQINGVQLDQYGLPQLVNMLGNIDVEIKVDEGPDTETVMGDVFDLLMALAQNNVPVPPAVIIEASALPISEKKKLTQMMNAARPGEAAGQQLQLQGGRRQSRRRRPRPRSSRRCGQVADRRHAQSSPRRAPKACRTRRRRRSRRSISPSSSPTSTRPTPPPRTSAPAPTRCDHKALLTPLQLIAEHAQRTPIAACRACIRTRTALETFPPQRGPAATAEQ